MVPIRYPAHSQHSSNCSGMLRYVSSFRMHSCHMWLFYIALKKNFCPRSTIASEQTVNAGSPVRFSTNSTIAMPTSSNCFRNESHAASKYSLNLSSSIKRFWGKWHKLFFQILWATGKMMLSHLNQPTRTYCHTIPCNIKPSLKHLEVFLKHKASKQSHSLSELH